MKYNIMDSEMEGKAKVNYNGQAPAKTLKMSFVPKHGEDLNLDFKMTGPSMQGWRFDFESQRSGTTLTKFHHEIDLVNNANIFDMNMKGELDMDPMSIFYNFFSLSPLTTGSAVVDAAVAVFNCSISLSCVSSF